MTIMCQLREHQGLQRGPKAISEKGAFERLIAA